MATAAVPDHTLTIGPFGPIQGTKPIGDERQVLAGGEAPPSAPVVGPGGAGGHRS